MIKPIQDFILVRPSEEKENKIGSIIIPGSSMRPEPTQEATVLAVGPGKQTPITSVVEGDTIVIPHYAGIEVIDKDGSKLVLIRVTDILAVVKE
jgi:chaperonin GroES